MVSTEQRFDPDAVSRILSRSEEPFLDGYVLRPPSLRSLESALARRNVDNVERSLPRVLQFDSLYYRGVMRTALKSSCVLPVWPTRTFCTRVL